MREKDEPAPPLPALAPERGYRDDRRSNETLARGRGARGVRDNPGGWGRLVPHLGRPSDRESEPDDGQAA